ETDGSWKTPQKGITEGAVNRYKDHVLRTTAYIAWALAEAGDSQTMAQRLSGAFDYIVRNVGDEKDPYSLAICANALVAGKHKDAQKVMAQLDELKQIKGNTVYWSSPSEGVTLSRGNVLDIETTALAAYAFMKAQYGIPTAHKALGWLVEQKDSLGNWHSTQATIYTFRALLLGIDAGGVVDKLNVTVAANGTLAKELEITKENSDVFQLISLRDMVKKGKNMVALETAGEGNVAYQIVSTHYVPWGEKPKVVTKAITIDVDYDATTLKQKDLLTCSVTVKYNRQGIAGMTIVDLGIPPGFTAEPGTFELLKDKGIIESYSITGRQVILYIDEIVSGKPLIFDYSLRAKYPVKVQAPSTKVYQYYEPEVRDETGPVGLTVI
ncbi:MAG: hypothetical protein GY757_57830, partial [bacterium]|nr:hypothetical protein [bacterium]